MSVPDNNNNFLPAEKDPLNELLDLWQAHRFHLTHRTRRLANSWEFAVLLPVYFSDIAYLAQSKSYAFTLASDLAYEVGHTSMTGQAVYSWILDQAEKMRRAGRNTNLSDIAIMNVYKHAVPNSDLEKRAGALLPRSEEHRDQVVRLLLYKARKFSARAQQQITHQPPAPGSSEVS